jgi:hypothetical protein
MCYTYESVQKFQDGRAALGPLQRFGKMGVGPILNKDGKILGHFIGSRVWETYDGAESAMIAENKDISGLAVFGVKADFAKHTQPSPEKFPWRHLTRWAELVEIENRTPVLPIGGSAGGIRES